MAIISEVLQLKVTHFKLSSLKVVFVKWSWLYLTLSEVYTLHRENFSSSLGSEHNNHFKPRKTIKYAIYFKIVIFFFLWSGRKMIQNFFFSSRKESHSAFNLQNNCKVTLLTNFRFYWVSFSCFHFTQQR